VVAGDDDHGTPPPVGEPDQAVEPEAQRLDGRKRAIEQVPTVEHEIGALGGGDADHLVDGVTGLVEPIVALESLPDVPVGGVEDLHEGNPACSLQRAACRCCRLQAAGCRRMAVRSAAIRAP